MITITFDSKAGKYYYVIQLVLRIYDYARPHDDARAAVVVVQDLDVGVELLADPVSDECSSRRRTCTAWRGPRWRDRCRRAADRPCAASMPSHMHSSVTRTSWRLSGSTSPTKKVAFVSPCTPPIQPVTSMLQMSPSRSGRESGMPWQMTSLIEVQQAFG